MENPLTQLCPELLLSWHVAIIRIANERVAHILGTRHGDRLSRRIEGTYSTDPAGSLPMTTSLNTEMVHRVATACLALQMPTGICSASVAGGVLSWLWSQGVSVVWEWWFNLIH